MNDRLPNYRSLLIVVSSLMLFSMLAPAAPAAENDTADKYLNETPAEKAARLDWWTDARFGMFIHWGPVSLKGTEIGWSRGTQIPREEYDNLYKSFNPEKFSAQDWVSTAKAAGMKYIVLTTKHHDGFCLWDSHATDYDIMNTPFGRDVVAELAAECKKQGIRFCAYYSIADWYQPDYNTWNTHGGPGYELPAGQKPSMDRYFEYMKTQLAELVNNYGPIGLFWFDGEWEKPWTTEYGTALYKHCRSLQPDIIINNRVSKGRHGMAGTTKQTVHNPGDYDTPEQQIGGFNTERPWETCMTICRQWAWKPDDNMKSLKQCLQTLIYVVGGDGNFLFNVGPMPDGRIEPRQVDRLREMGDWLDKYGEGIYQAHGGPFKPGKWGASTHKDNSIYLYVMNWPTSSELALPPIPAKIENATLLTPGSDLAWSQSADRITLSLPDSQQDPVATIVELTLNTNTANLKPVDVPSLSVAHDKPAEASNVYKNQTAQYGPAKAFDDDDATRWATDAGTSSAWLAVDLQEPTKISKALIKEAYPGRVKKFQLQYKQGGTWQTFHQGTTLPAETEITFEPVNAQHIRLNILNAAEGPTIYEFQLMK
ncbi:Alpha-L-fucosidase [Anaerohalosphaera lusitana]|uniref:alpha-L-fucosidase n=1 Tax=Anaerohalosphaera lusitana TaxID=1936003 RepID=A0A1U9NIM0_9BACT|nr:alpha-L-fucosidase [Anaerohalosphaera lusitana]AQT67588.1 Alpha-L-fucosidase [Anaerohalosphaera lusitana]